MAIVSSGSFVAVSNKIAGTTLTFTSSRNILSGDLAALFIASDNITTGNFTNFITSVTDNSVNYNFNQGIGFNNTASTIITQSNGQILVGGSFGSYNGRAANAIARLNTDGTLDTTFNANIDGLVCKLAIQPNVTGSYYSGIGVFSTGNALITARYLFNGAGANQNSAIGFGGTNDGGTTFLSCTEEYDGTSWTAVTGLIGARGWLGGAGTQNAALAAGGQAIAPVSALSTEEYNGSTWSAGGNLTNNYTNTTPLTGTQNAALFAAGGTFPIGCLSEEYNGTSWASGGNLINNRSGGNAVGAGNQNSSLIAASQDTSPAGITELYDGITWFSGPNMINNRFAAVQGAGSSQNEAIITGAGGAFPTLRRCTEVYDGTTWSTGGANITGRAWGGSGGSKYSMVTFGGSTPAAQISTCTEEYTGTTITTCISDKIIAVGTMTGGAIRLNSDGTKDPSFNVGTGFNNTVCTVIVQDITSSYLSNGVWTSGGSLINATYHSAGAGTQNSALNVGGFSASVIINFTEEYNGTSWTAGGNLINARCGLAGVGTQNLGLFFGGFSGSAARNFTEEYDGISWTAGNNMIVSRHYLAGAGTQNEGLAFGGTNISFCTCTEEYNGTSWAAGNALINARAYLGGAGTQNEALAIGGFGVNGCTEEYDGTTWTTGGTLINIDYNLAGTGTQNAAVAFGGSAPSTSCTEKYNGISWTTDTSMILPRGCLAGAGLRSAALAFGGTNPGQAPCFLTEEYTNLEYQYYNKLIFGGLFTSYNGITANGGTRLNGEGTLDTTFNIGAGFSPADVRCYQFYNGTGAWSIGGALITARNYLAGAGTQNAGLAFGGSNVSFYCSNTEEYDGTSWVAGGTLITGRSYLAGTGTQNESLAFGGNDGLGTTPFRFNCTEEYNGSIWIAGGNLINSRDYLAGAGTQNAALAFGGSSTTSALSCTEEYNGSSWAAGGTLITARYGLAGAGTQNEALAFGGFTSPLSVACTEEYNGTSWTIGEALINARQGLGGAGTQNAGLAFGGGIPIQVSCTEEYNGTSWTAGGTLINARTALAGAGTQNAGLAFGGLTTPTILACTEEYSTNNLLAVGNFTSVSGSTRNRIALLNADNGALISTSSFNIGTAGFNANVNSIAIQSDNTIIAVGNFTAYSGSNIARIAKLNTDGTLDTAFSASIGAGLNAEANVVVNYPYTGSIGSWVVGGALITARENLTGVGTQNSALAFGGTTAIPTAVICTEEYGGVSWTVGGTMIIARYQLAGAGTQNEALAFGGASGPTSTIVSCTEEYDGISWASSTALLTARCVLGGAGTQNAGLAFAGIISVFGTQCTEEYNGTSWSVGGNLINNSCRVGGAGTQNEALSIGGGGTSLCTEEYNGTTWAAGGALINSRTFTVGSGTQNAALSIEDAQSTSERYDGTSWARDSRLIVPRVVLGGGSGLRGETLVFGGRSNPPTPTVLSCTEEYTADTDRLLIGGTFTSVTGNIRNGSAMLWNNGNFDATFNIGSGFTSNVDVEDYLVEPDIDNGIIAVGNFTRYSGSFSPGANRIVKLTQVGTIDGTTTGNRWSKIREYSSNDAAGAGSTLALFYLTASYDIPQGTAITASISQSVTAKAATGWVFGADTPVIAFTGSISSSAAGGTSQPGSIRLSNLTSGSGEYLFIRGVAFEADSGGTTFTPTANFTTMSAAGTTGGANITNQSVRGEFRILTTASLASNPTLSAAASQASIFWTFYELVTIAGRTYFILLD